MPRTSIFALCTLVGALLAGPTYAAPQYGGTGGPGEAGSGGAGNVDCSDVQYRFDVYCQSIGIPAPSPTVSVTAGRTNELACPEGTLVAAGVDANGNRLYQCSVAGSNPATTFSY